MIFFGLFLLTNCDTKEDSKSETQPWPTSSKTQPVSPLTGEWKYKNTIWYSSELSLLDNGTFKFHDQGCYGQRFSRGHWTYNNEIIELTSFETFKQKERTAADKSNENKNEKKSIRKLKKDEEEYSFIGFKDASTPIRPGPNDTVRIYLDKIQLQLRNDTLYCIGAHKLPERPMFHSTKTAANKSFVLAWQDGIIISSVCTLAVVPANEHLSAFVLNFN